MEPITHSLILFVRNTYYCFVLLHSCTKTKYSIVYTVQGSMNHDTIRVHKCFLRVLSNIRLYVLYLMELFIVVHGRLKIHKITYIMRACKILKQLEVSTRYTFIVGIYEQC